MNEQIEKLKKWANFNYLQIEDVDNSLYLFNQAMNELTDQNAFLNIKLSYEVMKCIQKVRYHQIFVNGTWEYINDLFSIFREIIQKNKILSTFDSLWFLTYDMLLLRLENSKSMLQNGNSEYFKNIQACCEQLL